MRQSDVCDSARGRQSIFSRRAVESVASALTKYVAQRSTQLRQTQDGWGKIDSLHGESIFVTGSPKIYHEVCIGALEIALLGEYGQGKSTVSLMLSYHLMQQIQAGSRSARIPILLELRGKSPRTLREDELLSTWAGRSRT